jgi:hypothetical protein
MYNSVTLVEDPFGTHIISHKSFRTINFASVLPNSYPTLNVINGYDGEDF